MTRIGVTPSWAHKATFPLLLVKGPTDHWADDGQKVGLGLWGWTLSARCVTILILAWEVGHHHLHCTDVCGHLWLPSVLVHSCWATTQPPHTCLKAE